jgi:hypothetical protein
MGGVLAAIGTPSHSPKPRGKSPGWPEGQTRKRRIPYPTVKKGTTKQKQQHFSNYAIACKKSLTKSRPSRFARCHPTISFLKRYSMQLHIKLV